MASHFQVGEWQGDSEPPSTSPDDLKAFYAKMEQQEVLDRKLSRGQSTSKRSLWSRKSTKKPMGAPVSDPAALGKLNSAMDADPMLEKKWEYEKDDTQEKSDEVVSLLSRSIIPDPLSELPAWYSKENDTTAGQAISYRLKFPIHSPEGPRWYKNCHLIPQFQLRAANRPPSFFSPSFPPMAASLHDPSEDSSLKAGLNQSPAGSPMATPDSSQPDVATKPRSRKTSQTTPDTVDFLDVTDPWGATYHHQSPYDPGLTSSGSVGQVSPDAPSEAPMSPRSRRSSMTAGIPRRRTVTPSPLSQSTSALHLHPQDAGAQPSRKLSKRRKPLMGGLFGGGEKHTNEPEPMVDMVDQRQSASAPVTPLEGLLSPRSSVVPNGLPVGPDYPKRMSTMPPSLSTHPTYSSAPAAVAHIVSEKREKRGSMLGRMVKKLSIMRRPVHNMGTGSVGSADDWQHVSVAGEAPSDRNSRRSLAMTRHSLQEKPSLDSRKTDPLKRVPPPALELESSANPAPNVAAPRKSTDRRSFMSVDPPAAMGKLTIANPDAPSSVDNTPVRSSVPLPSELEPTPEVPQRPRESIQEPVERPKSVLPPLPDPADDDHASQGTATPVPALPIKNLQPSQQHRSDAELLQSPATDPMSLYPAYVDGMSSSFPPVPFPTSDPRMDPRPMSALSASARATIASSPQSFMDDSPLSRASMIVNPPTPHTTHSAISAASAAPVKATPPTTHTKPERQNRNPSPVKASTSKPTVDISKPKAMAPKPKVEAVKPVADAKTKPESKPRAEFKPKPEPKVEPKSEPKAKAEVDNTKDEGQRGSSTVKSRQTETFKLIRSPSGNVIPLSEMITAEGEQWVVESSDSSKKDKVRERSSRSKDRDAGSRKEPKRHEPPAPQEIAVTDQQRASRRQKSFHNADPTIVAPKPVHANSKRARSVDISHQPGQEVSKHTRKDSNLNLNKPQPPPPPPTPGPSRLERQPSASNRPTSELPSTAELNSLKAREAWDMDRLRKGKSMHYGSQPESSMATPPQSRDSGAATINTDLNRDNGSMRSTGHGSSHTSYMVQSLQGQPTSNMYYPNMASGPYDYSNTYRSPPPSLPFPITDPIPKPLSRPNPLPPPPRESSYQPSPLPPLSDSGRLSSDHWTKHPGVTTAH